MDTETIQRCVAELKRSLGDCQVIVIYIKDDELAVAHNMCCLNHSLHALESAAVQLSDSATGGVEFIESRLN